MGLRADQVELTRRTVIDAVVDLSADPAGGPITVAEVARRSGISPATIYRHFPNREALVTAAALERVRQGAPASGDGSVLDEGRAYLQALWGELAGNLVLTRQVVVSEAGRELRQARFDAYRPMLQRALTELGLDRTSPDADRLAACLHLLESAHAFLELHDRQGLSVDEAVEAVTWAQETLMRAFGLDPTQLRIELSSLPDDPDGGNQQ